MGRAVEALDIDKAGRPWLQEAVELAEKEESNEREREAELPEAAAMLASQLLQNFRRSPH